jgi:hypothetical protein
MSIFLQPPKEFTMVNHCANPVCHKPLHYLREGKVYRFPVKSTGDSKLPVRMEHFWLCGICVKEWTLTSDAKEGVKLVERRRKRSNVSYPVASAAPAS